MASAPRLSLPEWTEKHRIVVGGPRPGKWNWRNAPMAREPMECASTRSVQQVTICSPAQLMKSEFCINVALYGSFYGADVLLYEPDKNLLKEFVAKRIRPALLQFELEEVKSKRRGPKKRDSADALSFPGGGEILALSPKMKTGKSSHSAPVVILDEIDKMGDPTMLTVADSRTSAYEGDGIVIVASTPSYDAPGLVWRIYKTGSRGVWNARCPHCSEFVACDWSRVLFARDPDGYWLPDTAAMVCKSCGVRWSETDRRIAVHAGRYEHLDKDNPHRSFRIPGPANFFKTLHSIVVEGAAAWRGAQDDGEWKTYMMWYNERLGEVWDPDLKGLSAKILRTHAVYKIQDDQGSRGLLDPRAVLITVGIDVGEHALFCEWVAWGIDYESGQVICWALQYEQIGGQPDDTIDQQDLWRELYAKLRTYIWRHPRYGEAVNAQRVMIDCGYKTETIREWCMSCYQEQLMGHEDLSATPFGAWILPLMSKSIETGGAAVNLQIGLNAAKQRMKGILPAVVWIESNAIKTWLWETLLRDRRLLEGAQFSNIWPADGQNLGYTDSYFKEMANEVRIVTRTPSGKIKTHWEVKTGTAKKNDAWDCRIYAIAAARTHVDPASLGAGLLKLAVADADAAPEKFTKDELLALNNLSGGKVETGI